MGAAEKEAGPGTGAAAAAAGGVGPAGGPPLNSRREAFAQVCLYLMYAHIYLQASPYTQIQTNKQHRSSSTASLGKRRLGVGYVAAVGIVRPSRVLRAILFLRVGGSLGSCVGLEPAPTSCDGLTAAPPHLEKRAPCAPFRYRRTGCASTRCPLRPPRQEAGARHRKSGGGQRLRQWGEGATRKQWCRRWCRWWWRCCFRRGRSEGAVARSVCRSPEGEGGVLPWGCSWELVYGCCYGCCCSWQ